MYCLGLDIGSSSIKAALVAADSQGAIYTSSYPPNEMSIDAPQANWAEQDPSLWWQNSKKAIEILLEKSQIDSSLIKAIGIAYQMHGLVLIDKNGDVLRPAIIWCDSRASTIGDKATVALGSDFCLDHCLNTPGNFTASKLRWVREQEPEIYDKIDKMLLPGDYIAYLMSGKLTTTVTAMSEAILWDFKHHKLATDLMAYYEIDEKLVPAIKPSIDIHGQLHAQAAAFLGLPAGLPVSYKAGDQPNNALSLGALHPGQVAGTAGTSGVVYAITDKLISDPAMRINSFAHINHRQDIPRIGVLLCINGCGILYNWLRKLFNDEKLDYNTIEKSAAQVPIGSEGVSVINFGNGSERLFQNKQIGAQIMNLNFNTHDRRHVYRAALEGIAFSFYHGMKTLQEIGVQCTELLVGNDNLFQSDIFTSTLANLSGVRIKLIKTNGAIGAAKAAGYGVGLYNSLEETTKNQQIVKIVEPSGEDSRYIDAYERWSTSLSSLLNQNYGS